MGLGVRDNQGSSDWIPEAVMFEIISSPETARINGDFAGAFVLSATVLAVD